MSKSITRIYSQVYKSLNSLKRNPFRLSDVIIWPMIFLFTVTFFVSYLGSEAKYIDMIILGMIGWRVIYFLNMEIVSSFVEEYWSKSLPYLMISPISRLEMAIGSAISGFIKGIFVAGIYIVVTYFLYGFTIPDWPTFLLAIFFLMMIGFSLGLFNLGLGYFTKEQSFNLAFIIPDLVVLISGVYFSIDAVYPAAIIPYIRLLPSTLAFDLMKSMVGLAKPDLIMLSILSALWLVAAYLFNGFMYNKAKRAGKLTRLG